MSNVPVFFAPDLVTSWNENPGCLTTMNGFAPLQNGAYGTVGTSNFFGSATLTGADHRAAYIFSLPNGSAVFVTGRDGNLDTYTNAGVKTNIGTGYNGLTWSMASWGTQIIATNLVDAVQVSAAGAAFSALGGSPPKASYVAANQNFVMLAGIDTNRDQVSWSALQNPTSWTPSIATQAGNYRLLDTPGIISGITAFRDSFVVFKHNSIYMGRYIGVPYIFEFKPVSTRVGMIGDSAVECDGKLYFFHHSGFYEFDGQSLRNIGTPVIQSFLAEHGVIPATSNGVPATPSSLYYYQSTGAVQACADDIEGVVWWRGSFLTKSDNTSYSFWYGYNTRTGKWGRHALFTGVVSPATSGLTLFAPSSVSVKASASDVINWLNTGGTTCRFLSIWNGASTTLRAVGYPSVSTDSMAPTVITGAVGQIPGSQYVSRIRMRHLKGTTALGANDVTAAYFGYKEETQTTSTGTGVMSWNSTTHALDLSTNAEFLVPAVTYGVGEQVILGGIDMDMRKGAGDGRS